jgi:DNA-directed RNA polymerase beta subunit
MYNGMTGTQLETDIYIGPTYYERLKHMVSDKINYRQVNFRTIYNNNKEVLLKDAPVSVMTRQPTKGRGNNGGLRIGEMEKDSILSHGMLAFLQESLMERSDKYEYYIDNTTNTILHKDYSSAEDVSKVNTPYAFKQFVHELTALGIKPILTMDEIQEEEETYDDAYIDMQAQASTTGGDE